MTVGENLLGDRVCIPGSALTVPDEDLDPLAARLKVLGDPTRIRIVQILAANGSVCACDLEGPLGLSQPTVSHHLRQLTEAGLTVREKRGTWAFFRLADAQVTGLAAAIGGLAAPS
ncbi:ArsR/SmtB family transcription factor [Demequina sp. SO4-13]|uniref:ArsR/SmtB family transcription factor n=1 Tax=Demequina sp. SO4-13 TaxID=3401027 RepID=UPI003AF5B082